MNERQIRIHAWELLRKELLYKFGEAFTDGFCIILKNNVDNVVAGLKARGNALHEKTTKEREQG